MVKINDKYTYKDSDTFVLKEKGVLKAAKSNKSMFLNSINGPKLINRKYGFSIIHKIQQYISLLFIGDTNFSCPYFVD